MHSWENNDPLNHIRQDTKSARLIAVCRRSFRQECDNFKYVNIQFGCLFLFKNAIFQFPRNFLLMQGLIDKLHALINCGEEPWRL